MKSPGFFLSLLFLFKYVASAPDCGATGACGDCTDSLVDVMDPDTCHKSGSHHMCSGRTKDVCGGDCPSGYGVFKGIGSCGFLWTDDEKRCAQCSKGFSAEEGCGELNCKVWGIEVWSTCEAQGGCIPCSPGKYAANDGMTYCAECPAGKQSYHDTTVSSTQMIQISKDAGVLSAITVGASVDCYTCPKGKYSETDGELLCDTCKGNTYTDKVGQTSCPYCPPGKQAENWNYELITEGSNVNDFYKSCDSEECTEVDGTTSTKCNDCQRGRYSTNVDEDGKLDSTAQKMGCVSCALFKKGYGYTSDIGMDTCYPCPAGTRGNSSGLCEDCEPGKYQNSTGMMVPCNPCRDYGALVLKSTDPRRTGYISGAASDHCTPCPAGKFMTENKCLDCQPGKYSDTAWDTCLDCNVGKSSGKGFSDCVECGFGKFNSVLGGNCTDCAIGKYADKEGSIICENCLQNLIQLKTGQKNCTWCEAGKYEALGPWDNVCVECEDGKYRERDSNVIECKSCAMMGLGYVNGMTSNVLDTSTTPAGWAADSDLGHATCYPCPAGSSGLQHDSENKYNLESVTYDNRCHVCPDGLYSGEGSEICHVCGPGKEPCSCDGDSPDPDCSDAGVCSPTGDSKCRSCPAGKAGTGGCENCPVGKYQGSWPTDAAPGSQYNYCLDCAPGTESKSRLTGQTECAPCAAGNYSTGGELCKHCRGGFIPEDDQMFCKSCNTDMSTSLGGGEYAKPGDAECSKCPAGRFSPRFQVNTKVEDCLVCPPGKYTDEDGKVSCDDCEKGTFSSTEGRSTACAACDAGKVASEKGTTGCTLCVAGTYEEDRKECKNCDAGKYTDSDGVSETGVTPNKVNCEDCPAGKYQEKEGEPSCVDCEVGKHQEDQGETKCDTCSSGKTTAVPGQATCTSCVGGTVPSATDGLCDTCGAGTQNVEGECSVCAADSIASAGSTSCTPCPDGKFTRGAGDDTCFSEDTFFQICPIGRSPITNTCRFWYQDRLYDVAESGVSPFLDRCSDLKMCSREGSGSLAAYSNSYAIYCNSCSSGYTGYSIPNSDNANLPGLSTDSKSKCRTSLLQGPSLTSAPTMCYKKEGEFSSCPDGTSCKYLYVDDSTFETKNAGELSPFTKYNDTLSHDSCAEYEVCNIETGSGDPVITVACTKCASEIGYFALHESSVSIAPAGSLACAGKKALSCTQIGNLDTCPANLATLYESGGSMNCKYQISAGGSNPWSSVSPGSTSPLNNCKDYEICKSDTTDVYIQCENCEDGFIGTSYTTQSFGDNENTCSAYQNPTQCVQERAVGSTCPNYGGDGSIEVQCHYHAENPKGWKQYDQGDQSPFVINNKDTCKAYETCYHNVTRSGTTITHEYWVMCKACASGYAMEEGNYDERYNLLPNFGCIGNNRYPVKCSKITQAPTPSPTASPTALSVTTSAPTLRPYNGGLGDGEGGAEIGVSKEKVPVAAIGGGAAGFLVVALFIMYKVMLGEGGRGGEEEEDKGEKKKKKKKKKKEGGEEDGRRKKKKKKKPKEDFEDEFGIDRQSSTFGVENPMSRH